MLSLKFKTDRFHIVSAAPSMYHWWAPMYIQYKHLLRHLGGETDDTPDPYAANSVKVLQCVSVNDGTIAWLSVLLVH